MIEVLVVDDDIRVAKVNAAYVSRVPGFRVTAQAHSAAEALATIESRRVDLVLLDHYMPDRNGLAMVRELRRLGHHTDVIMVTAARDVATVQEAMRNGALQYLVKPFAYSGLRTKLEAYAALRHTLERGGEAEQGEVDRLFGALWAAGEPDLPKGHSPTTAELVRQALRSADGPRGAAGVRGGGAGVRASAPPESVIRGRAG
ncbi:response regulator, partial [Streptomyces sp. NPDC059802]|uniref:response regulator n=1 Tax=Streptomyces sp. NPDC059802 TaxID=3346952 RepID=UPI0036506EF4